MIFPILKYSSGSLSPVGRRSRLPVCPAESWWRPQNSCPAFGAQSGSPGRSRGRRQACASRRTTSGAHSGSQDWRQQRQNKKREVAMRWSEIGRWAAVPTNPPHHKSWPWLISHPGCYITGMLCLRWQVPKLRLHGTRKLGAFQNRREYFFSCSGY